MAPKSRPPTGKAIPSSPGAQLRSLSERPTTSSRAKAISPKRARPHTSGKFRSVSEFSVAPSTASSSWATSKKLPVKGSRSGSRVPSRKASKCTTGSIVSDGLDLLYHSDNFVDHPPIYSPPKPKPPPKEPDPAPIDMEWVEKALSSYPTATASAPIRVHMRDLSLADAWCGRSVVEQEPEEQQSMTQKLEDVDTSVRSVPLDVSVNGFMANFFASPHSIATKNISEDLLLIRDIERKRQKCSEDLASNKENLEEYVARIPSMIGTLDLEGNQKVLDTLDQLHQSVDQSYKDHVHWTSVLEAMNSRIPKRFKLLSSIYHSQKWMILRNKGVRKRERMEKSEKLQQDLSMGPMLLRMNVFEVVKLAQGGELPTRFQIKNDDDSDEEDNSLVINRVTHTMMTVKKSLNLLALSWRMKKAIKNSKKFRDAQLARLFHFWKMERIAVRHHKTKMYKAGLKSLVAFSALKHLTRLHAIHKLQTCRDRLQLEVCFYAWARLTKFKRTPLEDLPTTNWIGRDFPHWNEWCDHHITVQNFSTKIQTIRTEVYKRKSFEAWVMYWKWRSSRKVQTAIAHAYRNVYSRRTHFYAWRYNVLNKVSLAMRDKATQEYNFRKWVIWIDRRRYEKRATKIMIKVRKLRYFLQWRDAYAMTHLITMTGVVRIFQYRRQALQILYFIMKDLLHFRFIKYFVAWREYTDRRMFQRGYLNVIYHERTEQLKIACFYAWRRLMMTGMGRRRSTHNQFRRSPRGTTASEIAPVSSRSNSSMRSNHSNFSSTLNSSMTSFMASPQSASRGGYRGLAAMYVSGPTWNDQCVTLDYNPPSHTVDLYEHFKNKQLHLRRKKILKELEAEPELNSPTARKQRMGAATSEEDVEASIVNAFVPVEAHDTRLTPERIKAQGDIIIAQKMIKDKLFLIHIVQLMAKYYIDNLARIREARARNTEDDYLKDLRRKLPRYYDPTGGIPDIKGKEEVSKRLQKLLNFLRTRDILGHLPSPFNTNGVMNVDFTIRWCMQEMKLHKARNIKVMIRSRNLLMGHDRQQSAQKLSMVHPNFTAQDRDVPVHYSAAGVDAACIEMQMREKMMGAYIASGVDMKSFRSDGAYRHRPLSRKLRALIRKHLHVIIHLKCNFDHQMKVTDTQRKSLLKSLFTLDYSQKPLVAGKVQRISEYAYSHLDENQLDMEMKKAASQFGEVFTIRSPQELFIRYQALTKGIALTEKELENLQKLRGVNMMDLIGMRKDVVAKTAQNRTQKKKETKDAITKELEEAQKRKEENEKRGKDDEYDMEDWDSSLDWSDLSSGGSQYGYGDVETPTNHPVPPLNLYGRQKDPMTRGRKLAHMRNMHKRRGSRNPRRDSRTRKSRGETRRQTPPPLDALDLGLPTSSSDVSSTEATSPLTPCELGDGTMDAVDGAEPLTEQEVPPEVPPPEATSPKSPGKGKHKSKAKSPPGQRKKGSFKSPRTPKTPLKTPKGGKKDGKTPRSGSRGGGAGSPRSARSQKQKNKLIGSPRSRKSGNSKGPSFGGTPKSNKGRTSDDLLAQMAAENYEGGQGRSSKPSSKQIKSLLGPDPNQDIFYEEDESVPTGPLKEAEIQELRQLGKTEDDIKAMGQHEIREFHKNSAQPLEHFRFGTQTSAQTPSKRLTPTARSSDSNAFGKTRERRHSSIMINSGRRSSSFLSHCRVDIVIPTGRTTPTNKSPRTPQTPQWPTGSDCGSGVSDVPSSPKLHITEDSESVTSARGTTLPIIGLGSVGSPGSQDSLNLKVKTIISARRMSAGSAVSDFQQAPLSARSGHSGVPGGVGSIDTSRPTSAESTSSNCVSARVTSNQKVTLDSKTLVTSAALLKAVATLKSKKSKEHQELHLLSEDEYALRERMLKSTSGIAAKLMEIDDDGMEKPEATGEHAMSTELLYAINIAKREQREKKAKSNVTQNRILRLELERLAMFGVEEIEEEEIAKALIISADECKEFTQIKQTERKAEARKELMLGNHGQWDKDDFEMVMPFDPDDDPFEHSAPDVQRRQWRSGQEEKRLQDSEEWLKELGMIDKKANNTTIAVPTSLSKRRGSDLQLGRKGSPLDLLASDRDFYSQNHTPRTPRSRSPRTPGEVYAPKWNARRLSTASNATDDTDRSDASCVIGEYKTDAKKGITRMESFDPTVSFFFDEDPDNDNDQYKAEIREKLMQRIGYEANRVMHKTYRTNEDGPPQRPGTGSKTSMEAMLKTKAKCSNQLSRTNATDLLDLKKDVLNLIFDRYSVAEIENIEHTLNTLLTTDHNPINLNPPIDPPKLKAPQKPPQKPAFSIKDPNRLKKFQRPLTKHAKFIKQKKKFCLTSQDELRDIIHSYYTPSIGSPTSPCNSWARSSFSQVTSHEKNDGKPDAQFGLQYELLPLKEGRRKIKSAEVERQRALDTARKANKPFTGPFETELPVSNDFLTAHQQQNKRTFITHEDRKEYSADVATSQTRKELVHIDGANDTVISLNVEQGDGHAVDDGQSKARPTIADTAYGVKATSINDEEGRASFSESLEVGSKQRKISPMASLKISIPESEKSNELSALSTIITDDNMSTSRSAKSPTDQSNSSSHYEVSSSSTAVIVDGSLDPGSRKDDHLSMGGSQDPTPCLEPWDPNEDIVADRSIETAMLASTKKSRKSDTKNQPSTPSRPASKQKRVASPLSVQMKTSMESRSQKIRVAAFNTSEYPIEIPPVTPLTAMPALPGRQLATGRATSPLPPQLGSTQGTFSSTQSSDTLKFETVRHTQGSVVTSYEALSNPSIPDLKTALREWDQDMKDTPFYRPPSAARTGSNRPMSAARKGVIKRPDTAGSLASLGTPPTMGSMGDSYDPMEIEAMLADEDSDDDSEWRQWKRGVLKRIPSTSTTVTSRPSTSRMRDTSRPSSGHPRNRPTTAKSKPKRPATASIPRTLKHIPRAIHSAGLHRAPLPSVDSNLVVATSSETVVPLSPMTPGYWSGSSVPYSPLSTRQSTQSPLSSPALPTNENEASGLPQLQSRPLRQDELKVAQRIEQMSMERGTEGQGSMDGGKEG